MCQEEVRRVTDTLPRVRGRELLRTLQRCGQGQEVRKGCSESRCESFGSYEGMAEVHVNLVL